MRADTKENPQKQHSTLSSKRRETTVKEICFPLKLLIGNLFTKIRGRINIIMWFHLKMLCPLNLHLSYCFTYVSSYGDNLSFSFIYLVTQIQWPRNVHGLQLSLWLGVFLLLLLFLIVFPKYWINMTITLEMYKWIWLKTFWPSGEN